MLQQNQEYNPFESNNDTNLKNKLCGKMHKILTQEQVEWAFSDDIVYKLKSK
jgi:hypothetical protein